MSNASEERAHPNDAADPEFVIDHVHMPVVATQNGTRPASMRARRASLSSALLCLLLTSVSCRGGCSRARVTRGPLDGTLAWFPAETQIVVSVDFRRLRRTTLGLKLPPLATAQAEDRARLEEFTRRTGLDPFQQIDSLIVAFPEEARETGRIGVVLRGSGLDESRLVAYAREQVAKSGDDLFSFRHAGRLLWASRKAPATAAFFINDRTLVIGAGGWAQKMAELTAERSSSSSSSSFPPSSPSSGAELHAADANAELVNLLGRAGAERPLVAAVIVPASTRANLAADPKLSVAASVSRMAISLDGEGDTDLKMTADLATREQAAAMVERLGAAILGAKASPAVLLTGMGPFLETIHARADGVACEISVHLSAGQTEDLVERLKAFLALSRQGGIPGFPHP